MTELLILTRRHLTLYSKSGDVVLKSEEGIDPYNPVETHIELLDDGERVLGYRSNVFTDSDWEYFAEIEDYGPMISNYYNFQLIIGRLIWSYFN